MSSVIRLKKQTCTHYSLILSSFGGVELVQNQTGNISVVNKKRNFKTGIEQPVLHLYDQN
jgi:hypothetical protein